MKTLSAFLLAGALAGAVGVSSRWNHSNSVRAERFEVVDDKGKVIATIGIARNGDSHLTGLALVDSELGTSAFLGIGRGGAGKASPLSPTGKDAGVGQFSMLQLEWSPAESDEYCLGQLTAIGNDVSLELVKNSSICALNVKESGITISHEKDKIYKGKVEVSFEEAGPRLRGFDRNGDLVFSIP